MDETRCKEVQGSGREGVRGRERETGRGFAPSLKHTSKRRQERKEGRKIHVCSAPIQWMNRCMKKIQGFFPCLYTCVCVRVCVGGSGVWVCSATNSFLSFVVVVAYDATVTRSKRIEKEETDGPKGGGHSPALPACIQTYTQAASRRVVHRTKACKHATASKQADWQAGRQARRRKRSRATAFARLEGKTAPCMHLKVKVENSFLPPKRERKKERKTERKKERKKERRHFRISPPPTNPPCPFLLSRYNEWMCVGSQRNVGCVCVRGRISFSALWKLQRENE